MLSNHHEKKCRYSQCSLGNEPSSSSTTLLFAAMFGERESSQQKKTKSKLVFRHCFWQCAKSCQEKNEEEQQ